MFSVISLHCSVSFDKLDNHIVADIMKTWGLTGVPLFFMVSGYLTLGKDVSCAYIIRKIYQIIRFVACFSFLYWLTFAIKHMDFNIIPLLKGCVFSFVNRGYFPWFWFLGSMSIIYISLPVLNCFFPINQQMNPTPAKTINPDDYGCRYPDITKQWSRCRDEINCVVGGVIYW